MLLEKFWQLSLVCYTGSRLASSRIANSGPTASSSMPSSAFPAESRCPPLQPPPYWSSYSPPPPFSYPFQPQPGDPEVRQLDVVNQGNTN